MTQADIKAQIEKLSSRLTLASLPDSAKSSISKRIQELKSELEASKEIEQEPTKEEKKVETEVKEAVKEEQKVVSQADEEIKRIEKSLSNPSLPESAKAVLRSKLASLKQGLKESAKESTVEKKEVEKAEKEVEKAEKEVKKAKTPAKAKAAVEKVRQARKKRTQAKKDVVKKSSKRATKVKTLLQQLQAMMKKDESLKKRYKSAKKSGGVDLKRDADKKAMKPGKRISKGLTSNQTSKKGRNKGNVYYEYRFNRSDKQKSKYPYFEDGGEVMGEKKKLSKYEKGGLLDALTSFISSGYIGSKLYDFGYKDGLKYNTIDSVRSKAIDIVQETGDKPYSISNLNEIVRQAAEMVLGSPMSIREELDETVDGYMVKGGKVSKYEKEKLSNLAYRLESADEGWIKNNHSEFIKMMNDYKKQWKKVYGNENYDTYFPTNDMMAKGGYMEKGGMVKKVSDDDGGYFYLHYVDPTHIILSRSEDDREGFTFHVGEFKNRSWYNEVRSWLKSFNKEGGYMEKGGTIQNKRPYNKKGTYSKSADRDDKAKRVGYRFTDKKASRLGINANRKPTEEQIRKYNRNGVYWENRIDKSDVSRMKRLQEGGILSPMTGGVDADFRFDMLSPNF